MSSSFAVIPVIQCPNVRLRSARFSESGLNACFVACNHNPVSPNVRAWLASPAGPTAIKLRGPTNL